MSAQPKLSVVSSEIPDAPYPSTVKANGFRPEVDWQRIKSSKTWRLCPQDQRNNLLRLWLESWNEVPAGSWENDDELIAAAIDVPLRLFVAHRDILMRGWRQHSDGRLYHPVVTELVLAMLAKRTSAADRQRQKREREKEVNKDKQELADSRHGVVTRDSGVSHAQEQEQEQEQDKNKGTDVPLSTAKADRLPVCPHMEIIDLYHAVLPELRGIVKSRWSGSKDEEALRTRWREDKRHQSLEFWERFFNLVRTSRHWMGDNDRGWKADLRWLVQRKNFDKAVERMADPREAAHG